MKQLDIYGGRTIWERQVVLLLPSAHAVEITNPKIFGGEGDNRGWDGWMTQWTWVWVSSGSWTSGRWTGRPGMAQSMDSQRVGHDWASELSWTESFCRPCWLASNNPINIFLWVSTTTFICPLFSKGDLMSLYLGQFRFMPVARHICLQYPFPSQKRLLAVNYIVPLDSYLKFPVFRIMTIAAQFFTCIFEIPVYINSLFLWLGHHPSVLYFLTWGSRSSWPGNSV